MHAIVTCILQFVHNYCHDGREMTVHTTHRVLDGAPTGASLNKAFDNRETTESDGGVFECVFECVLV